jgi:hypothetical protein
MTNREDIDEVEQALENAYEERFNILEKINSLEKVRGRLRDGAGLPTEPGLYLNARDEVCRLTPEGIWDDGWGNGGWGYGNLEYYTPLRRLVVESE